ncbi:hypothetical protein THAOC_15916, partial [Thalassiosira oceanica]
MAGARKSKKENWKVEITNVDAQMPMVVPISEKTNRLRTALKLYCPTHSAGIRDRSDDKRLPKNILRCVDSTAAEGGKVWPKEMASAPSRRRHHCLPDSSRQAPIRSGT